MKKRLIITLLLGLFIALLTICPCSHTEAANKFIPSAGIHITQNGIDFVLNDATSENDSYAIIESYSNATNVKNGILELPANVTYNQKTYPVMGSNGFVNTTSSIREVIVPEDFGAKNVSVPEECFQKVVGANNFFVLPNVETITIKAKNLHICNLYADGNYIEKEGRNTVSRKNKIKAINISSDTISVTDYSISDLKNLSSLTFAPTSSVTLEAYGIVNCPSLRKLMLPSKTNFQEGAISLCRNLNTVQIAKGSSYTLSRGAVFSSHTLLFVPAKTTTYTVSRSVKKVGKLAFSNCKKLKKVTCHAEVIGSYAFFRCQKLSSIKLKRTKKIASYAFVQTGLSKLRLPNTVKQIGHGILYQAAKLKTISVSGKYFKSKKGILLSASGKIVYTAIPIHGKVTIPSGVQTVQNLAITTPEKITQLSFPSTLHKLHQTGKKMLHIKQIIFRSPKVPKVVQTVSNYRDSIFSNIGYDKPLFLFAKKNQVSIAVPQKAIKKYRIFLKKSAYTSGKYKIKRMA